MHLVCCCSLPVWRRRFLKKGTPVTYFCPALDPPLGGSDRKTTTLVRDHEYFIPTKFYQNPSSGSGEEVENVKSLQTDGRRTDAGRRTDGRTTDGALYTWAFGSGELKRKRSDSVLWQKPLHLQKKTKKATWLHKNATKTLNTKWNKTKRNLDRK